MKASLVYRNGLAHHKQWGGAFLEGLKKHGWEVDSHENALGSFGRPDLLVVWGIRGVGAIRRQIESGGEVCVLERGYVGDRQKWTSVSFGGGLNGRGIFRGPLRDPERWETLWADKLQQWRMKGGYALILGQVPTDSSISGRGVPVWYAKLSKALRKKGIEARFRPHPHARQVFVAGAKTLGGGSLQQAFDGCSFAITFNSNSGLDAVLAGVPTVTGDIGAMAWDVTSHSIDEPLITPERDTWCHKIAWCQYNEDELRSGFCWDMVKPQ